MALLEVEGLHAHYGHAPVLQGVSFRIDAGEIVGLFGRNGAGKTTTLRTIMGWLRPSAGSVLLAGRRIDGLSSDRIFRRGVALIPEDRRIFPTLSVEENLMLGLFSRWRLSASERRRHLDRVLDLFPRLHERRRQLGRTLSGGEQQMLAIGRALIGEPRLLLVDEPSEGLAPMVVNDIFASLARMREQGIALLLVEQNVRRAAAISSSCYIMEKGRIVIHGPPAGVLADEAVRQRLSV
ncbi:MAG TPA: ABC transporter ATP-binding protein [Xanthobacteraceae bacterium]|jgi:branched-chain amino acid transport system ATP-binding protein